MMVLLCCSCVCLQMARKNRAASRNSKYARFTLHSLVVHKRFGAYTEGLAEVTGTLGVIYLSAKSESVCHLPKAISFH